MGNQKRQTKAAGLFVALLTGLLFAGCIPLEDDQAADETNNEVTPVWAEGLTSDQIVKAMPIFVDEVPVDAATDTVSNIASAKMALTNETQTDKELLVTWAVPKGWLPFSSWKVYEGTVEGDWQVVDVEVSHTENASEVLDIEKYNFDKSYEVDCFFFHYLVTFTTEQYIKYFKIEMTDHNGVTYDSIVSFMVFPYRNPIQITLSDETSSSAPSDISVMLNGGWDSMWKYTETTELPLTETLEQTIDPWVSVRFQIETDFTGWGFENNSSTHLSNSSFCKVTKVEGYPQGDVQSRLRYAFEDLPIDRVGTEPDNAFDYNDVILYVDIMKLPE